MSNSLYNSRNRLYKSKYGALECGEAVIFRLLLPPCSGYGCGNALMHLFNAHTKETVKLPFKKTDEFLEGNQWWELEYRAEEPGLFFYCFEFYDGSGTSEFIYRGPYQEGFTAVPESSWQLTVYRKNFKVADHFKGATMYQIFPDRFYSSGLPKKNVPSDRDIMPWGTPPRWRPDEKGVVWNNDYTGGDLKGIQEKIPYLKELGITVIYMNPIFESHTNHRYSTADYSRIDPLLGTEQDFIDLCKAAHENGMYIILDGVFNHTGDDSIYFNRKNRYDTVGAYNSKESPYYPWFNFIEWPDEYESWWGFKTLPDVNQKNMEYVEYITGKNGIIQKWLKLGADGWRLDVVDELSNDFVEEITASAKKADPEALIIGEVWEDASNKIAYSEQKKYLLGNELDSVMNYPFANAIIDFLAYNNAEPFLDRILTITENYPKPVLNSLMNMLGTHDTARIITRLAGESCEGKDREWQSCHHLSEEAYDIGVALEIMASAIQYTLPGMPSLYYGDEAGVEGYKDPFNRTCFPWGHEEGPLLTWYRWLGKLRKNCPLLKEGQFVPVSGAMGCVTYARMDVSFPELNGTGDALVVIANRNTHPIDYYLPPELSGLTPVSGSREIYDRTVKIPPLKAVILGRGSWTGSVEYME